MPAMTRSLMLAAPLLLLAACGDEAAEVSEGEEKLDARGEVLGGSITDDMLPLDALTSQAPPQAGEDGATNEDAQQAADGPDEAGEPAAPDEAEPAPAAQAEDEAAQAAE